MRPGRETDVRIAKEVFGFDVWVEKKNLVENHPKGTRPLRHYTTEMDAAMEVAIHMKIAFFPVAGDQWFAFVGPESLGSGWESPQIMLEFLNSGNFGDCGAAVGDNPAKVICQAALKATEKRAALKSESVSQGPTLEVVATNSETNSEIH